MPKVIFKFDKEKDVYNLWETCNEESNYGYDFREKIPKDILEMCVGKTFEECKNELKKRLKKTHKNPKIKLKKKELNQNWRKIEKKYFKTLEKITNKKFPFKKVYGYLTVAPRCPYRPHWRPPAFYTPIFANLSKSILTSGHEIMHIHLHNIEWWNRVEKQLGDKKTHDLKEALTVLLNIEFKDLFEEVDKGYPNHVKLRRFIEKEWEKEKDFDILTEKCVDWIKKKM